MDDRSGKNQAVILRVLKALGPELMRLQPASPSTVWVIAASALAASSCSEPAAKLSPCWNADSFRQGQVIAGRVRLLASNVVPTMMAPLSCGQKIVVVDIPPGSLPLTSESQQMAPWMADYTADIRGVVDGTEQGRPRIRIDEVSNVKPDP
ncbi:hypothetical protein GGQ80_003609 [Sphingomonas jinjuensis]|uniref:Uncharacterized protein n=1 Tax=Sphingomonas jinjuensis TaxID=535907 RepID=A0A840FJ10_9SPHN|nr:hypothetical protein [Sphingomonas jinjuensis]MBB4155684.1 hypothetical protein [Sphingomonas jinjuensis]